MLKEIKLPEISENVNSADIISVMVKKGDVVDVDQSLLEVETDKASFDVPSTDKGTVVEVLVKANDTINVGQIIIKIDTDSATQQKPQEVTPEPEATQEEPRKSEMEEVQVAETAVIQERVSVEPVLNVSDAQPPQPETSGAPASPTVRRFARELGVDIISISGTGPGGRISQDDIKKHVKSVLTQPSAVPEGAVSPPLPDFAKWGEIEREKMSTVRKITAQLMGHAWTTIPHVTQFDAADITDMNSFIKKYGKHVEQTGGKLTITAIILKIVAQALKTFPKFNTSIDMQSNELIYKKYYNISIAVDTGRGLLVPVIRDVDSKSIKELSLELIDIAERTRNKKIDPADLEDGTFTISNQGGIGGTQFTPIVYWPQAAIIGISRSKLEPVHNGESFEPRMVLPLSLSYDHRIIDGADAARFLRWIKEALEQPILLVFE